MPIWRQPPQPQQRRIQKITGGIPTAITQAASNIGQTTARINGKISDDGGESCEARFRWRPITEATEEQTSYDQFNPLFGSGWTRGGQRLTILNRAVTKLSFPLCKHGSLDYGMAFVIRRVSDDGIILYKSWGNAGSLPDYPTITWAEVTFDYDEIEELIVDGEVRFLVEFDGGDSSNYVMYGWRSADVKEGECWTDYAGFWDDVEEYDVAYKYTYRAMEWTTTDWQNTLVTDSLYHEDLTDLEPGTEYEFQTQAKNSAGENVWSASAYFETLTVGQPTMRRWGGSISPIGARRIGKGW